MAMQHETGFDVRGQLWDSMKSVPFCLSQAALSQSSGEFGPRAEGHGAGRSCLWRSRHCWSLWLCRWIWSDGCALTVLGLHVVSSHLHLISHWKACSGSESCLGRVNQIPMPGCPPPERDEDEGWVASAALMPSAQWVRRVSPECPCHVHVCVCVCVFFFRKSV